MRTFSAITHLVLVEIKSTPSSPIHDVIRVRIVDVDEAVEEAHRKFFKTSHDADKINQYTVNLFPCVVEVGESTVHRCIIITC